MMNKIAAPIAEVLEGVKDGSVVPIGGFGPVRQPDALTGGLIEQGAKDLVAVLNSAGAGRAGVRSPWSTPSRTAGPRWRSAAATRSPASPASRACTRAPR
jgi:hypothetical protein